jgi:hypothetical protein
MINDEVSTNRKTVLLVLTEHFGIKKLRQDGAQESHRATAGCAIECSF